MYHEITSQGRAVAACIRSLDKENFTTDATAAFDSLDTTISDASAKRGENVLKALERRYHLLYLRAIEVQCMFEGLLERRSSPVSFFKVNLVIILILDC